MKTTFNKEGNTYEVWLNVKKIFIEFIGGGEDCFFCSIITRDGQYFQCAVSFQNLAPFVLVRENERLHITLEMISSQTSMMRVLQCQNLSQKWTDIAKIEPHQFINQCYTLKIDVDKVFFVSMPFHKLGEDIVPRQHYYCLITAPNFGYAVLDCSGGFFEKIFNLKSGDKAEITVAKKQCADYLVIVNYQQAPAPQKSLNHTLFVLP